MPHDFGGLLLEERERLPDGSMQFVFAGDLVFSPGDVVRGVGPVPAVFFVGNNVTIPAGAVIDFSAIEVVPGAGGAEARVGGSGGQPGAGGDRGAGGSRGGFGPGGLIYSPNMPAPVSVPLPGVPPAGDGEPGTAGRPGGAGQAGRSGHPGSPGFANPQNARGSQGAATGVAVPAIFTVAPGSAGLAAPYNYIPNAGEVRPPIFWGNPDARKVFHPDTFEFTAFQAEYYSGRDGGDGERPPAQPGPDAYEGPGGAASPFGRAGSGGLNLADDFALAGGSSGGSGSGGAGGPGGTGGSGGGGGGGGHGEFAEPFPTDLVDIGATAGDIALAHFIEKLVDSYLRKRGIRATLNIFKIPTYDIGASGGRGGRGGDGARGERGGRGGDGGPGGAGGGALLIHAQGRIVFEGEASAEGASGGAGLAGASGGIGPLLGDAGVSGSNPFHGFGMSTVLSPFSTVASFIDADGPSAGKGGRGGRGGGGGDGGAGFPGGAGGGGAGGTLIFNATEVVGSGEVFLLGGNHGDPDRAGGDGRFFLGNNRIAPATAMETALDQIGITVNGGPASLTRAGPLVANPFLADVTPTPTLTDLVGGAEAFGRLSEDAINIFLSESETLLTPVPAEAVIAVSRFDVAPVPFDQDYPGYDWIFVYNTRTNDLTNVSFGAARQKLDPVTGEPVPDPDVAEFSDGLAPFHSHLATYGGYARDFRFGGSGHEVSGELAPFAVYAFLVPEDTDDSGLNFVIAATNDGNDFRLEIDRLANGDTFAATFNPDINVYEAEWIGPTGGGPESNWNNADNWDTSLDGNPESGLVPNNTTARAFNVGIYLGSAQVFQDTRITIDRLGIGNTNELTVLNGRDLIIEKFNVRPLAGLIDNAGVIFVGSTGDPTSLRFTGSNLRLTGGGRIETFRNEENRIAGLRSSDSLIQEADHSILAVGELGANLLRIENHGVIEVLNGFSSPNKTQLTINPAGSPSDLTPGFINRGGARLSPGRFYSELVLRNGHFRFEELPDFNTSIHADNSNQIIIADSARWVGAGKLWEITGNSQHLVLTGTSTLEDLRLSPILGGVLLGLDATLSLRNTEILIPNDVEPTGFGAPGENQVFRTLEFHDGLFYSLNFPILFDNVHIDGGHFSFIDPGNLPSFMEIGDLEDYDFGFFPVRIRGATAGLTNVKIGGNYRFSRELDLNYHYYENYLLPEALWELADLIEQQDMVTVVLQPDALELGGVIENNGRITGMQGVGGPQPISVLGNVILTGTGGWVGTTGNYAFYGPDPDSPSRLLIDSEQSLHGPIFDTTHLFIENRGELSLTSFTDSITLDTPTATEAERAAVREVSMAINSGTIEISEAFGGGLLDNRAGRIIAGESATEMRNLRLFGGEFALHGFKTQWSAEDFEYYSPWPGPVDPSPIQATNLDLDEVTLTSPAYLAGASITEILSELLNPEPFIDGIFRFSTPIDAAPVYLTDTVFATHAFFDSAQIRGEIIVQPGVHVLFESLSVEPGAVFVPGSTPNPGSERTVITTLGGIGAGTPDPENPPRIVFTDDFDFRLGGGVGQNEVVFENHTTLRLADFGDLNEQLPFYPSMHLDPAGGAGDAPGFVNRGILDLTQSSYGLGSLGIFDARIDNNGGEILYDESSATLSIRDTVIEGGVIRDPVSDASHLNLATIFLENVTLRGVRLIDVSLEGDFVLEDCTIEQSIPGGQLEIWGSNPEAVEVVGELRLVNSTGDEIGFDFLSLPALRNPLTDRIVIEAGTRLNLFGSMTGDLANSLVNHGEIVSGDLITLSTPLLETGESISLQVEVPAPGAPIGEVVTLADLGITEEFFLSGTSAIINSGLIETEIGGILIIEAVVDNSGGQIISGDYLNIDNSLIRNVDGIISGIDVSLHNAILFGGELTAYDIVIHDNSEFQVGSTSGFGRESITTLQDISLSSGLEFPAGYVDVYATLFTSGLVDAGEMRFFNASEIAVAGSASVLRVGEFHLYDTLRLVEGTLEIRYGYQDFPGSRIIGGGIIDSLVPVSVSGFLAPGDEATGTLTFTNDLELLPDATLRLKLDAGGKSDRIIVGGAAPLVLGGTLDLGLVDGYSPAAGDSFTILRSNQPITGSFKNRGDGDRVNLPGAGSFRMDFVETEPGVYDVVLADFLPEIFFEVFHVDAAAAGSATGADWANAFTLLEDALRAAQPSDEIWVAAGQYHPPVSEGIVGQSYHLPNGILLAGGFNGTETDRDQRDPSTHIAEFGFAETPSILETPVFVSDGNTAHTVLDGIRIASSAPGFFNPVGDHPGGGLHVINGSRIRIVNCTFADNQAMVAGSAIRVVGSSPVIEDSTFLDNAGTAVAFVGGVADVSGSTFSGSDTGLSLDAGSGSVSGSVFTANATQAMRVAGGGEPEINNGSVDVSGSTFSGNGTGLYFDGNPGSVRDSLFTANTNRGMRVTGESDVEITGCQFIGNSSNGNGGGLVISYIVRDDESIAQPAVRVDRAEFRGNQVTTGTSGTPFRGGAIFNSGILELSNSLLAGNHAGGLGGGLYQATLGNVFFGDSAYLADGEATITNTTLTGNRGDEGAGGIAYGQITLVNSVVWNNAAADDSLIPDASVRYDPGALSTSHSLIQSIHNGGPGDLDGTLPSNDPLFRAPVDPFTAPATGGDARLLAASPVFGIGDPAAVSGSHDLDGQPRPAADGTVSPGAYERQSLFYVDAAATGSGSGLEGANAIPDLAVALNSAIPSATVRVAAGTYYPTGGTDRTVSFELPSGATVLGGYPPGGGFDEQARDPVAHPAILSGNIGDPGVTADNSFHVVTGTGLSPDTVFDGFTITGGRASGENATQGNKGGGMLLTEGSAPLLKNLTFVDNTASGLGSATTSADADGWGGGLAVIDSSPVLVDCHFENNFARGTDLPLNTSGGRGLGGAIAYINSGIDLLRVSFHANEAIGGDGRVGAHGTPGSRHGKPGHHGGDAVGGALHGFESEGTIFESTFRENRSRAGAGGKGGNGIVGPTGPTGTQGSSGSNGGPGGMGGPGGSGGAGGAGGTSYGGGLALSDGSTLIVNTRFEGNFTFSPQNGTGGNGGPGGTGGRGGDGGDGGPFQNGGNGGNGGQGGVGGSGGHAGASGRSFGGAIHLSSADVDLINPLLVANHAIAVPEVNANNHGGSGGGGGTGGQGGSGGSGGIGASNGSNGNPGFSGSFGSDGTASPPGAEQGGGIRTAGGTTRAVNLSAADNHALDSGAAISGSATLDNSLFFQNTRGDGTTDHTNDGTFAHGGDNLLTGDPRFVRNPDPGDGGWESTADNDYGDLRLLRGSPALNTGDNALNSEQLDLAGEPRIVGVAIDLGAYEGAFLRFEALYPDLNPLADGNNNSLPAFVDLAIGNDPEAPGGKRPTGAIQGAFYSYPLQTGVLDVDVTFEMSTDLMDFEPMTEGVDYERLGHDTIRLLSPPPDRHFLRHGFQYNE